MSWELEDCHELGLGDSQDLCLGVGTYAKQNTSKMPRELFNAKGFTSNL